MIGLTCKNNSIQNCAMVYASTLALERFGRRRTMSGDSSSGATLMNGAPPGSGMDYALPAIGHTGGGAAGVPGGAIRPAPGLSKHLSSSSTATLPPGATARLLQQQPQYGGESAGAPSSAAAGLAVMHSPPMPPAVLPFAPAASLIAAQNRAKRASAETMFRAAAAAASPTPSHPFPSTTAVTGSMPPEYQLKRATLERDAKEEDEEDESTTAGRSSIGGAGIAKSAGPKSTATTPPVRMQRVASGVWAIDDDEMSMMVPDAAAMAVAIELGEMGIGAGGRMVDDECEVAWDESETDVVQVDEEDRSRTEYF
ncbi:hypothetical protein BC828DRAFT_379271 [Blastocladiella britannica]|nr:hypothetical protein BC828DRAFT_379271 [Blastocladiella britannica]